MSILKDLYAYLVVHVQRRQDVRPLHRQEENVVRHCGSVSKHAYLDNNSVTNANTFFNCL